MKSNINYERLKSEWCEERNTNKLDYYSKGSNYRATWKCEKEHIYIMSVKQRFYGRGCPICAGKKVIAGLNDLATICPEVASEWNSEKNRELSANSVTAHSCKKVWWKCKKGHEWAAIIADRSKGTGCPYCRNRRIARKSSSTLTELFPDLAKEWSKENCEVMDNYTVGSSKKVVWECSRGHKWKATINMRTAKGTKCPYCALK